jgi:hypothetical protein
MYQKEEHFKDVDMMDNFDEEPNPDDNIRKVIEIGKPKKLEIKKANKSEEKYQSNDDYYEESPKRIKQDSRKLKKNTKEEKNRKHSVEQQENEYKEDKIKSNKTKPKKLSAQTQQKPKSESMKPSINLDKGNHISS